MKKNISIIVTIVSTLLFVLACEKPEIGYLSDNIFYNNSVYNVQRGKTTYTAPIVANGSTLPLNVELINVKDSEGKDVTSIFKEPSNIRVFKEAVTYKDSTLTLLTAKFKDSLVQPFRINQIGGRLEFTPATKYLPGGSYTIDVKVSNEKGERTIQNAAKIVLSELIGDIYTLNYKRINSVGGIYGTTDEDITVKVEYTPGIESETKCIYKFIDKNGVPFNPKAGEITRRALDFPFFNNWNPWFPVVLTDTTIEQQMPGFNGIKFPYFQSLVVGGRSWADNSARYDLKIPKGYLNEVNEDLFMLISFNYFVPGTFKITTQVIKYTKK